MSGRLGVTVAAALVVLVGAVSLASAFPQMAQKTDRSCATCHTKVAGGPELTDAGKAYKADPSKAPAANVEGAEYVSNRKCRVCHLAQFKSWAETPHAKAMATLRTASAEKIAEMAEHAGVKLEGPAWESEACLSCHTTGYKLAGGYPAASDSVKNEALAVVGCESCHGPGSKHVSAEKAVKKNFINRAVGESFCVQCHTPSMSPKFDYKEYKAKGLHAVAAAKE